MGNQDTAYISVCCPQCKTSDSYSIMPSHYSIYTGSRQSDVHIIIYPTVVKCKKCNTRFVIQSSSKMETTVYIMEEVTND